MLLPLGKGTTASVPCKFASKPVVGPLAIPPSANAGLPCAIFAPPSIILPTPEVAMLPLKVVRPALNKAAPGIAPIPVATIAPPAMLIRPPAIIPHLPIVPTSEPIFSTSAAAGEALAAASAVWLARVANLSIVADTPARPRANPINWSPTVCSSNTVCRFNSASSALMVLVRGSFVCARSSASFLVSAILVFSILIPISVNFDIIPVVLDNMASPVILAANATCSNPAELFATASPAVFWIPSARSVA